LTIKINGQLHLEAEEEKPCEMCGTVAELRPYGPNYENICFPCGMKDEETSKQRFRERMNGPDEGSVH
jgi:hypothetical protein